MLADGSLAGSGLQTARAANRTGTNAPSIGGGSGLGVGTTTPVLPCWCPPRMGDAGNTPPCCSVHPTSPLHLVRTHVTSQINEANGDVNQPAQCSESLGFCDQV